VVAVTASTMGISVVLLAIFNHNDRDASSGISSTFQIVGTAVVFGIMACMLVACIWYFWFSTPEDDVTRDKEFITPKKALNEADSETADPKTPDPTTAVEPPVTPQEGQ